MSFYARMIGPVVYLSSYQPDPMRDQRFFRGKLFKKLKCECGAELPVLFRPDPGRSIEVGRLKCMSCGAIVEFEVGTEIEGWRPPTMKQIRRLNRRFGLLIGVEQ